MTTRPSASRSFAYLACVAVVLAAFTAEQTACSSKVCTSSEETACTNTFTDCTTKAALSASKDECQKCVDAYCNCYDSCGNTCDRSKYSAACR